MKKLLVCCLALLALSFVSCGLEPTDTIVITREVPVTVQVTAIVTATPWYKPFEPPFVDVNGRWYLGYVVIDYQMYPPFKGKPWLRFTAETSWEAHDGCNDLQENYENGIEISETLAVCWVADVTTGEKQFITQEFSDALAQATAYGIYDGELWIFYAEDKSDALVFRR